MSRTIHRAPLALTTDGAILVNVADFDTPMRIDELVKTAMRERGAVFIGITASPSETRFIMERLFDSTYEAASLCAGRRMARARRRKNKTSKKLKTP